MKKIYYNDQGWVCNRYPHDLPVNDEDCYIEVDDEEYEQTLGTSMFFAWRVVDGELVNEEYTNLTEEQTAEKNKFFIALEKTECQNYLSATDYVVTKINEAQAFDDQEEIISLRVQYAEIFQKRKECRQRINELESCIL